MEAALDGEQAGDVVVDGEDGRDAALLVPDVDGAALEYAPVVGPGEVGELVLELGGVGPERLEDDVAGPVADLAAADVAVFDEDDAAVGLIPAQVMDDHLAVAAKMDAETVCELPQHLQRGFVQHPGKTSFCNFHIHFTTANPFTQAKLLQNARIQKIFFRLTL